MTKEEKNAVDVAPTLEAALPTIPCARDTLAGSVMCIGSTFSLPVGHFGHLRWFEGPKITLTIAAHPTLFPAVPFPHPHPQCGVQPANHRVST